MENNIIKTNESLIETLIQEGFICSNNIADAMLKFKREYFLTYDIIENAYDNINKPLLFQQYGFSISSASAHSTFLECLDIQKGHSVLDIGCGSGFITSICGYLVGKEGYCLGIDIDNNIIEFCGNNIKKVETITGIDLSNVHLKNINCFLLSPSERKFDRIHVGASCPPSHLKFLYNLLKEYGIIVVYSDNQLNVKVKIKDEMLIEEKIDKISLDNIACSSDKELIIKDKYTPQQMIGRIFRFVNNIKKLDEIIQNQEIENVEKEIKEFDEMVIERDNDEKERTEEEKVIDIVKEEESKIPKNEVIGYVNEKEAKKPHLDLFYLISNQIDEDSNDYMDTFNDLDIIVDEKTYKLHQFIVSVRCNNLLSSEYQLKLKDISNISFKVFLKWIYKGTIEFHYIPYEHLIQSLIDLWFIYKEIVDNQDISNYFLRKLYNEIRKLDNHIYTEQFMSICKKGYYDITELYYIELKERNIDKKIKMSILLSLKEFIKEKHPNLIDKISNLIQNSNDDEFDFENHYNQNITELIKTRPLSDITFKFNDDQIIHGHKSILLHRFPYLKTIYNPDNPYIDMNQFELDYDSFNILINYYYSNDLDLVKINEENYKSLLLLYKFIIRNNNKSLGYIEPLSIRLHSIFYKEIMPKDILSNLINYLVYNIDDDELYQELLIHFSNLISENKDIIDYNLLEEVSKEYLSVLM